LPYLDLKFQVRKNEDVGGGTESKREAVGKKEGSK
jgi:hypothetical protein